MSSNTIPDFRDEHVYVRVSPGEKRAMRRRAERAGLTLSEFVRAAAENEEVVLIDTAPLGRALTELHRQGVNLNGLARAAHRGELWWADADSLSETLALLRDAYASVTECLISIREEAGAHRVSLRSEPGDWAGAGEPDDPDARESWERPSLGSEARLARAASRALESGGD